MNPNKHTLRLITESDIDSIFEVRIRTWHNSNGRNELKELGITPVTVKEQLATTHRGWLCQKDQEVVGFAIGDRTKGEMWVIAVLKDFEGQGIGGQLLSKVEDWLFQSGWQQIWLTTDPDENYRAVKFYKAHGWIDWKIENGDRFMTKTSAHD